VVQHSPASNQHEIDMSADKDRGIRRQKQKRAKDMKRQARQERTPAGTTPSQAAKPAKQQAA
jgi:hypothetical protein